MCVWVHLRRRHEPVVRAMAVANKQGFLCVSEVVSYRRRAGVVLYTFNASTTKRMLVLLNITDTRRRPKPSSELWSKESSGSSYVDKQNK